MVYLIGHSLGGWNAAHLSSALFEMGYEVEYLVTLDPVGKGIAVSLVSDIYWSEPTPKFKSNNWINIRAEVEQDKVEANDRIADLGMQWEPSKGPGINETLPLHHREVEEMFTVTLATGKSVLQILIDNLTGHLKLKGKEYAKLPEVILD